MVARSGNRKSLRCEHFSKMALTYVQTECTQWVPRQECDTPLEIAVVTMLLYSSLYQSLSEYEYHQKRKVSSPIHVCN